MELLYCKVVEEWGELRRHELANGCELSARLGRQLNHNAASIVFALATLEHVQVNQAVDYLSDSTWRYVERFRQLFHGNRFA